MMNNKIIQGVVNGWTNEVKEINEAPSNESNREGKAYMAGYVMSHTMCIDAMNTYLKMCASQGRL